MKVELEVGKILAAPDSCTMPGKAMCCSAVATPLAQHVLPHCDVIRGINFHNGMIANLPRSSMEVAHKVGWAWLADF